MVKAYDMTSKFTTVSIMGDDIYKSALRAVSNELGLTMGEMITNAVNTVYGDRIRVNQEFFAARRGERIHHIQQVKSIKRSKDRKAVQS